MCPPNDHAQLILTRACWDAIFQHSRDCYPNESVGMVCGAFGAPAHFYRPLRNLKRGREFEVCRSSLRSTLVELEEAGLEPLIFCHSHPDGVAELSQHDVDALVGWPALTGVIAVTATGTVDFRVFSIDTRYAVRGFEVFIQRETV